jgi:RimJ/RimL family protein N-acetyltransferase
MRIHGKRLTIRAIEIEDLPLLHNWFNEPVIARELGDIHFPSSLYQQHKWFERIQTDEQTIRLAVQTIEGTLIGLTGFWHLHWRDSRAEHAVVIGTNNQGLGYGREVIMTCARYAFQEMGLHRLEANILSNNVASLKAYQSCGFKIEGVQREHARRGGVHMDRTCLGLLASDYAELIQASRYWETSQEGQ